MSYFGKKWRMDPTWGDFALLVLVWGYLFILAILCFRSIWWAVLLAVACYSIIIYLTFRHVRRHKDKQKDQHVNQNCAKSEIVNSKPAAEVRDVNSVYLAISQILEEVFGKYVSNSDSMKMADLRQQYEQTHNPAILASLKQVCEEYSLFTHVYLYAILGERSQNPSVANKAKSLFNEIMGYINTQNATGLENVLEQNNGWLHENIKKELGFKDIPITVTQLCKCPKKTP